MKIPFRFLSLCLLFFFLVVLSAGFSPIHAQMNDMEIINKAQTLKQEGKYQEAVDFMEKEIENSRKRGNFFLEMTLLLPLADTYSITYQYEKAIECYRQSIRLIKDTGMNTSQEAHYLRKIGENYSYLYDYPKTLEYFQEAMELAKVREDRKEEAILLNNMGVLFKSQADYKKAEEYLQSALQLNLELGEKKQTALVLANLGLLYQKLYQYDKSLDYYQQAIKINQEINNEAGVNYVRGNMGAVYNDMGRYEEALKLLQQDLDYALETKDNERKVISVINMADTYTRISQYGKAMDLLNSGLELSRRIRDKKTEAICLNNLGMVYSRLSYYQKALEYYESALNLGREWGEIQQEPALLSNIGALYFDLSQYNKALEYYKSALKITRETGNKYGEGVVLNNIAVLFDNLYQNARALENYEKSLEICRYTGDRDGEATRLGNIGGLYISMAEEYEKKNNSDKERECYKSAQDHLEKALKLARELKNKEGESLWWSHLGGLYRRIKQYDKSLECYQSALTIAREQAIRERLFYILFGMGKTYKEIDQPDQALVCLYEAVDILEDIRSDIISQNLKKEFFKTKTGVFELIIEILINKQEIESALLYAESSKARNLLDMMGQKRLKTKNPSAKILAEREDTLREEIRGLEIMLPTSGDTRSTLEKRLQNKKAEHREVMEKLSALDPQYVSLKTGTAKSMGEIRSCLANDEIILEYYMTDKNCYLWTITQRESECGIIPTPRDVINQDVLRVRDQLLSVQLVVNNPRRVKEYKDKLRERLAGTYNLLISPVEDKIRGKNTLIIVPHGNLHFLPFSALVDKQGKYLIENYNILTEPSSSALVLFRDSKPHGGNRFVGYAFGNTLLSEDAVNKNRINDTLRAEDLSPLPGTEEEVNRIAGLFMNKNLPTGVFLRNDFSVNNVEKELKNARYLHLATHGFIAGNDRNMESSGILTSRGEIINIADIFQWDINAELVVLSACKTGMGSVSGGDDIVGLSRSFMYAGAENLIATLWSVSDNSTRDCMVKMYEEILAGKPHRQALRDAQLSLLTNEKYSHPYFWAPFVLYGK